MVSKDLIERVISEEIEKLDDSNLRTHNITRIFEKVYGNIPMVIGINSNYADINNPKFEKVKEQILNYEERRKFYKTIQKEFNGIIIEVLFDGYIFCDNFIMDSRDNLYVNAENAYEILSKVREFLPDENIKPNVKYVSNSQMGICTFPFNITKYEGDPKLNYNDDLPLELLEKTIRADKSSISILYGHPGTGKSYALRYLIDKNRDLRFYWLDSSMIYGMTDSKFIDFLMGCKDAIFIIEDCEKLLVKREDSNNSLLTSVLNLSDGMLGDSLNVKFICTFNTDLENIDPAVLRKGRLACKYEFKELTSDKVKTLTESLGINIPDIKPMYLCDIYNYNQDNGVTEDKPIKIGFK